MNNNTLAIAGALSGPHGIFSAHDLVDFGQTVIVKPGAKTDRGVMITGAYVAGVLGDEYAVFPVGVEYGADPFEEALAGLDDELEMFGDELTFGGARRLRKRYLRVLGRYRKCMTKLQIKAKRGRQRRCDRRHRKMVKRWQKMQRKGFDTSDLISPEAAKAAFVAPKTSSRRGQTLRPGRYVPPVMPLPAAAMPQYETGPAGPAPGYFADQAALEREVSSVMPSYGADQRQLSADLRSAADTYALSGIEHDYFGLGGSDVDVLFSEDDDLGMEAEFSDEMFDDDIGDDDEDLLGDEGDDFGDDDDLGDDDDDLGDDDDDLGDDDDDDLGDDDDDDLGDDDDDDLGDDDDDDLGDDDEDLLGGEEDDDLGETLIAHPDDVGDDDDLGILPLLVLPFLALTAIGQRQRKMKRWLKKGGYLSARRAKKVARWRTKWKAKLARAKKPKRKERLRKRIAMADKLLSKSAIALGAEGAVDYGRVRPKTPGTKGVPVVVIGIRKRPTAGETLQGAVAQYGAQVGHFRPNPKLLDVYAVGLMPDVHRVNTGWSAPVAMMQIAQHTHPSNWRFGGVDVSELQAMDGEISNAALGVVGRFIGAKLKFNKELNALGAARDQLIASGASPTGSRVRDIENRFRVIVQKVTPKYAAALEAATAPFRPARDEIVRELSAQGFASWAKYGDGEGGETGVAPFPMGAAPPFPPPRRAGPEVR